MQTNEMGNLYIRVYLSWGSEFTNIELLWETTGHGLGRWKEVQITDGWCFNIKIFLCVVWEECIIPECSLGGVLAVSPSSQGCGTWFVGMHEMVT